MVGFTSKHNSADRNCGIIPKPRRYLTCRHVVEIVTISITCLVWINREQTKANKFERSQYHNDVVRLTI